MSAFQVARPSLLATLIATSALGVRADCVEPGWAAEPYWLLQAPGASALVWFEHDPSGALVMVRCATGAGCRQLVDVKAGQVVLDGLTVGGVPATGLVPAWVVPTAGSRTGH